MTHCPSTVLMAGATDGIGRYAVADAVSPKGSARTSPQSRQEASTPDTESRLQLRVTSPPGCGRPCR